MAKLEKIKAGDVLYDVHSERMGNTTMRRTGIWEVRVREVNAGEGWALVSWNGNSPRRYYRHQIEKLRVSKPKKMNGHVQGCAGYAGWLSSKCTCPPTASDSKET